MVPDGRATRAIDANVILRYLLQDIPRQSARTPLTRVRRILGLSSVVLAEVAWTLSGPHYGVERKRVAILLAEIFSRDNIVTLGFDKEEALAALRLCASSVGAPNFGDALIAACTRSAGIDEIYAFGQRFNRADMTPIEPA